MLVTDPNDHITHAVISTNKVIEYKASDSAEFFNILSSTLYSDQILAVVREVICNAWDAHIEAGIQDVPIDITLDRNKLVIKDYGHGINHDDIGPIYGVYGASTKLDKSGSTGGFGLGCKAPFAYTDSFEVVSCHKGTKTIYRMSRSSALVGGKPGIIPIASMPTEETGLTVTIDIDESDYSQFKERTERVLQNGQIKAKINGELFTNTLNFEDCSEGFLITDQRNICDGPLQRVLVKYGSVIYPVTDSDNLKHLQKIINILLSLPGSYKIIFLAPPNTISVTPSRETLSMQEHTIKTLNNLMENFLKQYQNHFRNLCAKQQQRKVDELIKTDPSTVFSRKTILDPSSGVEPNTQNIKSLEELSEVYMLSRYPTGDFIVRDLKYRMELGIKHSIVDRGLARSYIKALDKASTSPHTPTVLGRHYWLHKRVIKPLVTKMGVNNQLDPGNLYVYDHRYSVLTRDLVPAKKCPPTDLAKDIPFLEKVVVLCTSRTDFPARLKQSKEVSKKGAFLFYQVSRKKDAFKEAEEFFKGRGYKVYNFNLLREHIGRRKTSTSSVSRPRGIPALDTTLTSDGNVRLRLFLDNPSKRLEDPEFIALITPSRAENDRLSPFTRRTTKFIINEFGSKGAIARSQSQEERYLSKGAVPLVTYLESKVLEVFKGNERLKTLYLNNPYKVYKKLNYRLDWGHPLRTQYPLILYQSEKLKKFLGISYDPTELEEGYVRLFHELSEMSASNDELLKLQTKYEKEGVSKETLNKLMEIANKPVLSYLNLRAMHYDLSNKKGVFEEPEKGKKFVEEYLFPLLTGKEPT